MFMCAQTRAEDLRRSSPSLLSTAPSVRGEEEESPAVLLCKQHAEDRREITARLGKMEKTMKGVVEVLGMLANAEAGVAKSKSEI